MSGPHDYLDDMNERRDYEPDGRVDRLLAESGLDQPGSGLNSLLGDLAAMSDRPVPQPSPELAQLFDAPIPISSRPRWTRRAVVGAGVLAAVGLGVSGAAASEHRPSFIQHIVDDVGHHSSVTPTPVTPTRRPKPPASSPTATPGVIAPTAPAPTTEPDTEAPPSGTPSAHPSRAEPDDSSPVPSRSRSEPEERPEPSRTGSATPSETHSESGDRSETAVTQLGP